MAEKTLRSIKFPGLPDTYRVPDWNTLENKPFEIVEENYEEVVFEGDLTYDANAGMIAETACQIIPGETYTIYAKHTLDGVLTEYTYTATAWTLTGGGITANGIGNQRTVGGSNTGEDYTVVQFTETGHNFIVVNVGSYGSTSTMWAKLSLHAHSVKMEVDPKYKDVLRPSWNDLKDRPFYNELTEIMPETVFSETPPEGWVFEDDGFMAIFPVFSETPFAGDTIVVTVDGVDYTCTGVEFSPEMPGSAAFGNIAIMMGTGNTGEPFVLVTVPPELVSSAGFYAGLLPTVEIQSATVKVSKEDIKKIDPAVLPDGVGYYTGGYDEPVTIYDGEFLFGKSVANDTLDVIPDTAVGALGEIIVDDAVVYTGVVYTGVLENELVYRAIGNLRLADSTVADGGGDYLVLMVFYNGKVSIAGCFKSDAAPTGTTMKVTYAFPEIHKIDEKFMPDSVKALIARFSTVTNAEEASF